MPPGGPVDNQPPALASVEPDSGATGLAGRKVLRFRFSEKMNRQPAQSWLRTYPALDIRKTSWNRATTATVEFFDPLPADTVVVVEILPGMSDSHKVRSERSYRYPLATGDSIPSGTVTGMLVQADTVLAGAVAELYPIPPDTLEYYQQDPVRRTLTDETGTYRFDWLPVPGGPWLLRAFTDSGGNLRPADKDAQRLHPDTLRVEAGQRDLAVAPLTLYAWNTPGTLHTGPFAAPRWDAPVGAFALAVSAADTGWSPAPVDTNRAALGWLDAATGGSVAGAPAGAGRVVVFVDLDADSTFGAVPDSLWSNEVAALADTVGWYLEPWGLAEGIELEPGLEARFDMPAIGDSLVAWTPPPPPAAPADSLATVAADTLGAPASESPEAQSPNGAKE